MLQAAFELGAIDQAGQGVVVGHVVNGRLGLAVGPAQLGIAQLSLDGGHQAVESVLHDVVVGTGAHRLDGDLLTDAAGDDDHGQVGIVVTHFLQCLLRIHGREVVIGDDYIPGALAEGPVERLGAVDSQRAGRIAVAPQLQLHQHGVILGIFDNEKIQRFFDLAGLFAHPRGVSFSTSQ